MMRKRYRELEKEGNLLLVCPECKKVVTRLAEWSVRAGKCRFHQTVFKKGHIQNVHDKHQTSTRAMFILLEPDIENWETVYDLTVFKRPQVLCLHCNEIKTCVLYRNYMGCFDCLPDSVTRREPSIFRLVTHSVNEAIEAHVLKLIEQQGGCTNPERVARMIRSLVYQIWYHLFTLKHGIRPCRFAKLAPISKAWAENVCVQDFSRKINDAV